MPVERSAGIIFFRSTPQGRKYLVIRSSYHGEDGKHNFWDFPKGLLEKDEDGMAAAKREAVEEAGIKDYEIISDFKETVRYFVRRPSGRASLSAGRDRDKKAVLKFVAMFLAETKTDTVKLSWEHDTYEWLPYEEAKERLSRKEMQTALLKAEEFLKKLD